MSLNFSNLITKMMLGEKSGTTYIPNTLENTYIAGNVSSWMPCKYASKITFDVKYTTGAGETNNSIELKVEFSPDGANVFQVLNESVSGGTSTLTQREFTFVGASAATAYTISLPLDIFSHFVRISAKESGVAVNKGTISIEATLLE